MNWSTGIVIFLALVLVLVLNGCVTTGGGKSTLVPAPPPPDGDSIRDFFPDLISSSGKLRPLTPGATTDSFEFNSHLEAKMGASGDAAIGQPALLSLTIRDRTTTPRFVPADNPVENKLVDLYLDRDLAPSKVRELAERAKSQVLNVPDLPDRTTLHDITAGKKRYYFYPRVQVDFSSKLNSPSQLDRLSYLGFVLEIVPTEEAPLLSTNWKTVVTCPESPRFIDFQPKSADIVEYSRGDLTQKAEAAAKASMAAQSAGKQTTGAKTGPDTAQGSTGTEQSSSSTVTPEVSLSMSETFVNSLKDSIEARTAGILREGKALFADFRAIKNHRIGGTYSFDVMLEVPTRIDVLAEQDGKESGIYVSMPCVRELRVRAYLLAVVRHVYERGFTGFFTRVPEPDNDKVYLQVVARHLPSVLLWSQPNVPWVQTDSKLRQQFQVEVITNRADARYVVMSAGERPEILGAGSGLSSTVTIDAPEADSVKAQVVFLDIVESGEKAHRVYAAQPSEFFTLPRSSSGKAAVLGNYGPK